MSNQGARQASARAIGGSAGTYNDDFMRMFTVEGVPLAGDFDGRFLQWLNIRTGRTYTNLPEAMTAFAVSRGVASWDAVATFPANTPPPVNSVAPVISGTPSVGQTLTTTNGTWSGSPTFTYQWVNSSDGNISGATSTTYLLQASDVGDNITCRVTATNAGGSASAVSNSLGPVAAVKTYADFQAHIATLATNGVKAWNGTSVAVGSFRTTTAAAAGSMAGSPWGPALDGNYQAASIIDRTVQHSLPSQAEFNSQVAAGREIFLTITNPSISQSYGTPVNRNGYTSIADFASTAASRVTDLIYWDGTAAQRMNPFAGTGPTPYVF